MATFLALNRVMGTLFSSENSFFIQFLKKIYVFLSLCYYHINIILDIDILRLVSFSSAFSMRVAGMLPLLPAGVTGANSS